MSLNNQEKTYRNHKFRPNSLKFDTTVNKKTCARWGLERKDIMKVISTLKKTSILVSNFCFKHWWTTVAIFTLRYYFPYYWKQNEKFTFLYFHFCLIAIMSSCFYGTFCSWQNVKNSTVKCFVADKYIMKWDFIKYQVQFIKFRLSNMCLYRFYMGIKMTWVYGFYFEKRLFLYKFHLKDKYSNLWKLGFLWYPVLYKYIFFYTNTKCSLLHGPSNLTSYKKLLRNFFKWQTYDIMRF